MALIKLGEAINIMPENIQSAESVLADPEIVERFQKFAAGLKTIAPMAKDFLYFTAVMMHAAEAALLDADGNFKKNAGGDTLSAKWETVGDGVRWVCSDANIRPYKNSNNDIFPEEELIKAHKKWIGRPLCLDHKSSSVDAIRGVIVDTYYDRKHKRVIALCALDKVNYPDLARKVATGYATSVSMGTAVGRAICSECCRVARVEADFCDHMRSKSCYGEINLDLSPIELSIVVNGADPGAKIKHIIAKDLSKAADHLHEYVENKISQGNVSREELAEIQKDLSSLADRVNRLVEAASKQDDSNDAAHGMTRSQVSMAEPAETTNSTMPPNMPEPWALWNSQVTELRTKLSSIQQGLNNLMTNIKTINEEPTMSDNQKRAYFQGAGGPNEPTPGKPKYEKEDYETIRDTQDKQMVGQGPFPGVGPVDGMYPGYDSFGESEESRKKRLQRMASREERALRRQAELEKAKERLETSKEAYFQGGGGPNEPTPGKRKYEVDPLNEQARKEDKHMVGQKPFPDVGPVDGMHPGYDSYKDTPWGNTEEARKQNLGRSASLKARFTKAAAPDGRDDLGNSRWDVFAGKKLIFSATVNDLTGGKTTLPAFSSIATENFGMHMLDLIKSHGVQQASSLLKSAQAPAQAQGAPGAPMDAMPAMPPAPVGDMSPPDEPDASVGGSPKDHVMELADKVKEAADDLVEAVRAMEGETPELEDVPPADEAAFSGVKAASVKSLQSMRKSLNSMLRSAMKEAVANLRAHGEELLLTASIYDKNLSNLSPEQRKYLDVLASDAAEDALSTLSDTAKLMSAYVKYAHGTDSLLKRAAQEDLLVKEAKKKKHEDEDEDEEEKDEDEEEKDEDVDEGDDGLDVPSSTDVPPSTGPTMPEPEPQMVEPGEVESRSFQAADDAITPGVPKSKLDPEFQKAIEDLKLQLSPGAGMKAESPEDAKFRQMVEQERRTMGPLTPAGASADDMMIELPGGAKAKVPAGTDISNYPAGTKMVESEFDLTTNEGRAAYRMKLAQKGLQFSDMIGRAHPKGGHQPGGFDTKPSDNLGYVETIEEVKEEMMDLAKLEPKARKQAEKIQELVSSGRLDPADVDQLTRFAKVDPAAVQYWKQYYGQAGDAESKEFASKLVAEHANQKMAAEIEKREVKIARAYDLAYEMRDRGIIEENQVKSQVAEILKWNDAAFDSTKRMVLKQAIKKQASVPQVGLLHSGDVILPAAERTAEQQSLVDVFTGYFAGRKF